MREQRTARQVARQPEARIGLGQAASELHPEARLRIAAIVTRPKLQLRRHRAAVGQGHAPAAHQAESQSAHIRLRRRKPVRLLRGDVQPPASPPPRPMPRFALTPHLNPTTLTLKLFEHRRWGVKSLALLLGKVILSLAKKVPHEVT